ncbi:hypothetical protein ATH50_3539 [Haloplanus aerogenes]|uniref:Uncharacterized protein n=1 Tax=Haloplanus aerogenes TaxID=660522 RepID=A0A3M0CFF4_9EURY|nr:hypothetical protein ATH50_3539 [Haloplanus aerogenes]
MIGSEFLSSNDEGWSRRRLLTVAGTTTGVALAGCSGVTSQSFAASPVILPDSDQEAVRLAETRRDSQTITRSGPGGSKVELTNHTSIHKRANGIGGQ